MLRSIAWLWSHPLQNVQRRRLEGQSARWVCTNGFLSREPASAQRHQLRRSALSLWVLDDASIWPLAYTTDGGAWATSGPRPPIGLTTWQPIATVEFGHRLHIFARDSATSVLRF